MKLNNIAVARLYNQQIPVTKFNSVKELVGWMGAVQAQDFEMSKWALGVRLPGSTVKEIEDAISSGEIIRTHILRPTWHYVLPEDLKWMRALHTSKAKASLSARDRSLGISLPIISKSKKIIERALSKGEHLTGDELAKELEKNKIDTGDYRAWHLFYKAELDGIICSGRIKNGKPTFALLDERVPSQNKTERIEALALLAKKYFTSHGPATISDFAWWSGLNNTDAKRALESVKSEFYSAVIDEQTYWFPNSNSISKLNKDKIYLLPAFDELIISYKNRTAYLPSGKNNKVISNNGIFKPVIVLNGKIAGTWKRTASKNKIIAETNLFHPLNKIERIGIFKAFDVFGKFLSKEIELTE